MNISKLAEKIEKTIGSMKFAVVIILFFAISLAVGTFVESYLGTDFVNRLIYKSVPFMLLQFLMFLSIFVATLLRMPFKKRLYGFYVLHLGLLLLFIGSFVTYYAGVDGSLTLPPNSPNNIVVIPRDILKIQIYDTSKNKIGSYEYKLPYNALNTQLNLRLDKHIPDETLGDLKDLILKDFYPFADKELKWISDDSYSHHAATLHLYNDRFGEKFSMALHDKSDFPSSKTMGLLNIHYMPTALAPCFGSEDKDSYIIWDVKSEKCFTQKQIGAKISKTKKDRKFLVFPDPTNSEAYIKFFPDFSPLPISNDMKVIQTSPFRVLSKTLFEKKPHLFIFGQSVAFYEKDEDKWSWKKFSETQIVQLPWMDFKLRLIEFKKNHYPKLIPVYTYPIQENGKLIKGDLRVVKVTSDAKEFYVTNKKPTALQFGDRQIDMVIDNKSIKLPYELNLSRFKMDKNPGTNNPASYESFVTLFTGKETKKSHVYMNNPLKHKNFTFYQASYFESKTGFGSVLSVNFDPGRWLKYLGSILFVLGCIWHFGLRKLAIFNKKQEQ
jgi:hypothetical protein